MPAARVPTRPPRAIFAPIPPVLPSSPLCPLRAREHTLTDRGLSVNTSFARTTSHGADQMRTAADEAAEEMSEHLAAEQGRARDAHDRLAEAIDAHAAELERVRGDAQARIEEATASRDAAVSQAEADKAVAIAAAEAAAAEAIPASEAAA